MLSTDRQEFAEFHHRLTKKAPKNYTPWYFPVVKKGKAPDTRMSWKAPQARINHVKADERLAQGYNVGISGRKNDRLILVDIDDPAIESELKPTLKIRSRSRIGTHAIYWADPEDNILPCNIPTNQGEVRSSDQYVVAPGSYVPCPKEDLQEKIEKGEITEQQAEQVMNDPDRGKYTIDNEKDVATITFEELPAVFKEAYKDGNEKENNTEKKIKKTKKAIANAENKSALYSLKIEDVAPSGLSGREPHPLHDSGTGKNWMIGRGVGLCWRHLVSLNAIQYLCVQSGYLSCLEAGSPHRNSEGAPSAIIGDDRAIWEAWREAKKQGYIPEDDPVPRRALHHIARKHNLCKPKRIPEPGEDKQLYWRVYYRAVEIIEEEY